MKKVDIIKAKRYFQDVYGLFIDIERHKGKIDICLGTTACVIEPVLSRTSVAGRDMCCQFYGGSDMSDKKCIEEFEAVYWNYASAYIFFNVSDSLGFSLTNLLNMENSPQTTLVKWK